MDSDEEHELLKRGAELNKEHRDKYYPFLRHIMLLASGTLSLLITLHKSDVHSQYNIYYDITLVLIGLGILFGAFSLYSEVVLLRKAHYNWSEHIRKKLAGESNAKIVSTPMPFFYRISEWVCYVSLMLSLGFLVLYAILNQ